MRLGVLLFVAACSFSSGAVPGDSHNTIDTIVRVDARAIDAQVSDAALDAPDACDQTACLAAGGSCSAGTCDIIHNSGNDIVTCPTGMPCKVLCADKNSCQVFLLECSAATSCELDCEGDGSCTTTQIKCPTNAVSCTVQCTGNNACESFAELC